MFSLQTIMTVQLFAHDVSLHTCDVILRDAMCNRKQRMLCAVPILLQRTKYLGWNVLMFLELVVQRVVVAVQRVWAMRSDCYWSAGPSIRAASNNALSDAVGNELPATGCGVLSHSFSGVSLNTATQRLTYTGEITNFWDVTRCDLVDIYWYSYGPCRSWGG